MGNRRRQSELERGELMQTAVPKGFKLLKQTEPVRDGDIIMTAWLPGEWRGPVDGQSDLAGQTARELGESMGRSVRVARLIKEARP